MDASGCFPVCSIRAPTGSRLAIGDGFASYFVQHIASLLPVGRGYDKQETSDASINPVYFFVSRAERTRYFSIKSDFWRGRHGERRLESRIETSIEKYRGRKHPFNYGNMYQLLVMVVLSARDSDKHINKLAPALFAEFPTMAKLAKASFDELAPLIDDVNNFRTKAEWLMEIAKAVKTTTRSP